MIEFHLVGLWREVFDRGGGSRSDPELKYAFYRVRGMLLSQLEDYENEVIQAVESAPRRGQKGLEAEASTRFNELIEILEKDGGVEVKSINLFTKWGDFKRPASSDLLLGRWKLLFTSVPGTESPIQRTFTGVDAFGVFQDVIDVGSCLRTNNIVDFGDKVKSSF